MRFLITRKVIETLEVNADSSEDAIEKATAMPTTCWKSPAAIEYSAKNLEVRAA
jgi:hypothetical protein